MQVSTKCTGKNTGAEWSVCECALAALRVRTRRPVTARSRPRECALSDTPLHTCLWAGWLAPSVCTLRKHLIQPFCHTF